MAPPKALTKEKSRANWLVMTERMETFRSPQGGMILSSRQRRPGPACHRPGSTGGSRDRKSCWLLGLCVMRL